MVAAADVPSCRSILRRATSEIIDYWRPWARVARTDRVLRDQKHLTRVQFDTREKAKLSPRKGIEQSDAVT